MGSFRRSLRDTHADRIHSHALYSKPCRVAIPVMQGILILGTLACIAFVSTWIGITYSGWPSCNYAQTLQAFEEGCDDPDESLVTACASYLFFPVLALLATVTQSIQRYNRCLGSGEVVTISVFGAFFWIVWGLVRYEMIFLMPVGVVLNLIYMTFGAIAVHREKKMFVSEKVIEEDVEFAPGRRNQQQSQPQQPTSHVPAYSVCSSMPPNYRSLASDTTSEYVGRESIIFTQQTPKGWAPAV